MAVKLQRRVLKLLDEEAALVNAERSQFVRQLIGRARGKVFIDRHPKAPPRRPLTVPAKGKSLPTEPLDFKVEEAAKEWLRETSYRMGGVAMSAIITILLLDWCGINPLAGESREAVT